MDKFTQGNAQSRAVLAALCPYCWRHKLSPKNAEDVPAREQQAGILKRSLALTACCNSCTKQHAYHEDLHELLDVKNAAISKGC